MVIFSLAFEGDRKIEEYIKLAYLSDNLGFYSFQIYEHLPFKPAIPISFIIANYTKKIKVGPVTIPVFLYHPLQLSRYISFLNEISNGRAIVGISRGAYYELLGKKVKRGISEVINFIQEFKKYVKENVEIYVGTSGPILAENVAKLGIINGIVVDMLWNPMYAKKMKEIVSKINKEIQIIARPFTFISSDKSKMVEIIKFYIKNLVGNSPMLNAAGIKYEDLDDEKIIEDKVIPNFTATGSVEEVLEQTAKIVEAGVDHVCYGHPLGIDPYETIKLIKDKIISYFK